MNPLEKLNAEGQSVWLDYIRRSLIESGGLARMVREDGVSGVTSNPAIFKKAISGSTDYAQALEEAAHLEELDAKGVFERLALWDIRAACDVFKPLYNGSNARDGYVSYEVSPRLAHDTAGTIAEAKRLWSILDRPNVMIKVPATEAGLPAIQALIAEGINVNVTLLFSVAMYERVVEAYMAGVEEVVARGGSPARVASVASFFVSRVDAAVDRWIEERLAAGAGAPERLRALGGKVAVANAKVAYQSFRRWVASKRWQKLRERGAMHQRLLWASTSTKNPAYSDVLYVEALVGRKTVNTIPPSTLEAFRDHGEVAATLTEDVEGAQRVLEDAARLGLALDEVTAKLLDQGVELFVQAYDDLLESVEERCANVSRDLIGRQSRWLPSELETKVAATIAQWDAGAAVRRLWAGDASLWTGGDEGRWLGWLAVTDDQLAHIDHLHDLADEVQRGGFKDVVVLGMGGSSLCPEVLARTFGSLRGYPSLHILDSTDPAQVADLESRVDLAATLFIVASKSGSTLEPTLFFEYFFRRLKEVVGVDQAATHCVAVTDPGSKLEERARELGFRRVYLGVPSIGGRFSALSNFGMVPAAAMGLNVARFLDNADEMVTACAACVPTEVNPGVGLGVVLGVCALAGRDKLTLVVSPELAPVGAWLEQLIAESTGKSGKAIIPIDGEALAAPASYGDDRLFAYLRLEGGSDPDQDRHIAALRDAGQPVVQIDVPTPYDLGQEFFRWEFATAVAGSVLGIHPFNQPDVEASKVETRRLTEQFEASGSLPEEEPFATDGVLSLYANDANLEALGGRGVPVEAAIQAHLARLEAGDYFALLAYVAMTGEHAAALQALRHAVRDAERVATCLGFGPRFLHSTGQAYKGGPNSGVFLQITCDDAADLTVGSRTTTFGVVKAAQARGDLAVLEERGRRVLRVHLGVEVAAGLAALKGHVERALAQRT